MAGFLEALVAVIVEAILKVFSSQAFMKAIIAAAVYVFLFSIIPLLIQFLVPSSIMGAISTYVSMLAGGQASLTCSGSEVITSSNSVTCNTTIMMTQWGQGIAYILQWFQFVTFMQCMLPAMSVAFLFKRI